MTLQRQFELRSIVIGPLSTGVMALWMAALLGAYLLVYYL